MRVRDDSLLAVTLALRAPDTAAAAIEALRGRSDAAAVEGLYEVIAAGTGGSRTVTAAVAALEGAEHPLVPDALRAGLRSRFAPARLAAVQVAHRRGFAVLADEFAHLLRADDSWPNRRAALLALANQPEPHRWEALTAADDPHWRVRHALVRVLTEWGRGEAERADIFRRLAECGDDTRVCGLVAYLGWAWRGTRPTDWSTFEPADPYRRCPFWDWDPAVLAAKLNRMTRTERAARIDAMPFLVGHEDERVWKPAVETIRDAGEPRHFTAALAWLDDPRHGAAPAVERLFQGMDDDRADEIGRWVCETLGREARLPQGPRPSRPLDRCGPFVRAVSLSPERAAGLVADPERETSWHVLEAACRMVKVPVWQIEPEHPWRPVVRVPAAPPPIKVTPAIAEHRADLGRERLEVSRVGVSGHYLLPAEGFVRAAEAGVNWFFWEPNYTTLTDFSNRVSPATRRQFHFVAGTFEAEGPRIRRDVDRALRTLKVERLGLFLIFWVQSWDRLTDDVRDAVQRIKYEGKAAVVGLSSHDRPLLVRAMEDGWNPVMARHSAAHRGAEECVFPRAVELGVPVITFNNLCYGRMLRPVAGLAPPEPADYYRYSLSQPGVAACWSAPATVEQLDANLRALADPHLPDARREALRRFGDALYREETAFRRLVRVL